MTTDSPLHIVVLAAGKGTRMHSALPKVLHRVGARPLIDHVLDTARALDAAGCHVVIGHGGEQVRDQAAVPEGLTVHWAHQPDQLGTAHAVDRAMPAIPDDALVLVMYGDVPLVRADTLSRLATAAAPDGAVLGTVLPDPTGYGRLLRDAGGRLAAIVEEKEADDEQRAVREVNTGLLCVPAAALRGWLARIGNDNAKGEYYLTDLVALAAADGRPLAVIDVDDPTEVEGVNDRAQLARAERTRQRRRAAALLARGVTLLDPERFDLRGSLEAGRDVVIDADVIIEGDVVLGDGVHVEAFCLLRDSDVGAGSRIAAHSMLEGATVGSGCAIGPFARLRPGTVCEAGSRVGNFVEIKNSRLGAGAKANHLSYVGDATVGDAVNIGAGTITCNYDGASKHHTDIGEGAFIGSNTALVAPVRVGRNATIAAGSVITRDAPDDALTLARAREQKSVAGWKRPKKKTAAPDAG